jgi:hypothetical protein
MNLSFILGKHILPFPLVKIDGEEEFEIKENLGFVSFLLMLGILNPLAWI